MRVVTPEAAYRAFWIWWTVVVALGLAAGGVVTFIAARLWLVNLIVDAIRELKK